MPPVPPTSNGTITADDEPESFWQKRRFQGAIAGLMWLFVFAGGVLIDAEDSRVALGWKRQDVASQAEVGRTAKQLLENPQVATAGDPKSATETIGILSKVAKGDPESIKAAKAKQDAVDGRWPIHNFLCGMLFFTPINVALLALLAGFVGGCLSSKADLRSIKEDMIDAEASKDTVHLRFLRLRYDYLTEHPFHSTVRSFIIYLIFISGLYVFSSDPFNANSQVQGFTQYMRLAGIVSLLGFVVGYDPTKFREWLALVPSPSRNPGKQPDPDTHTVTDEKKIVVTQTHQETLEKKEPEIETLLSEPTKPKRRRPKPASKPTPRAKRKRT